MHCNSVRQFLIIRTCYLMSYLICKYYKHTNKSTLEYVAVPSRHAARWSLALYDGCQDFVRKNAKEFSLTWQQGLERLMTSLNSSTPKFHFCTRMWDLGLSPSKPSCSQFCIQVPKFRSHGNRVSSGKCE